MRGVQFAQLTAFVAVAEHSSFTRAAAHLGMSKPSLSTAIRTLEQEFGVRLLNRTTRSVALTEAGAELLGHLAPVMEGVDRALDAVNAFRVNPAGKLRLVVHPVAAATVVAPLVARFSAAHPGIRLDVHVSNERKDIVSERFDAGVYFAGEIASGMIAVPIGDKVRLVTVASLTYLARSAPPSVPADLTHHNCIRYDWGARASERGWLFTGAGNAVEVHVDASLSVNDPDFAVRAALDGLGVAAVPDAIVGPLVDEGRLIRVLPEWTLRWADFVLYYTSRRHVPVKLRALIDFLRKESKRARSTEHRHPEHGRAVETGSDAHEAMIGAAAHGTGPAARCAINPRGQLQTRTMG